MVLYVFVHSIVKIGAAKECLISFKAKFSDVIINQSEDIAHIAKFYNLAAVDSTCETWIGEQIEKAFWDNSASFLAYVEERAYFWSNFKFLIHDD